MNPTISTPCIRACKLNNRKECLGCGRFLDEIAHWQRYSETERQRIMKRGQSKINYTATDSFPNRSFSGPLTKQAAQALRAVEASLQGQCHTEGALIAILDCDSTILTVNQEWWRFAEANGAVSREKVGVGAAYLTVCQGAEGECSAEASAFLAGLSAVLSGQRDEFELVSPCHSPTEKRWFAGRVYRYRDSATPLVAVLHLRVV